MEGLFDFRTSLLVQTKASSSNSVGILYIHNYFFGLQVVTAKYEGFKITGFSIVPPFS